MLQYCKTGFFASSVKRNFYLIKLSTVLTVSNWIVLFIYAYHVVNDEWCSWCY